MKEISSRTRKREEDGKGMLLLMTNMYGMKSERQRKCDEKCFFIECLEGLSTVYKKDGDQRFVERQEKQCGRPQDNFKRESKT